MVLGHLGEYESVYWAAKAIDPKVGVQVGVAAPVGGPGAGHRHG